MAERAREQVDVAGDDVGLSESASRVGKVREPVNSRILLGEDNASAATLPPLPGRGIWQWQTHTQFQAPWLAPADAEALLSRAYGGDVRLMRRIGMPGELKGREAGETPAISPPDGEEEVKGDG